VLVGKIAGVHGIRGNCKIRSYAESLSVFDPGSSILVATPDGREKVYEIKWTKPHSKVYLLAFEGVNNRDQAKALIGSELYIDKAKLPKLEDGAYYWLDLIGLDVFTTEEHYLGRLDSIIPTGSNDVYVVKDDEKEILIPALESIVQNVDLGKKRMLVKLPEGL